MRLILFDIDGTLVNTGGAGVRAMNRTFREIYRVDGALQGIALAGRTDRVIVHDAVARLDPQRTVDDEWLERFRQRYFPILEEEMANGAGAGKRVLPGVRPLLDALAARDDIVLGLLTGNFAPAARIKLAHFGLWDYFTCGAYGDAHVDRNLLLEVAREAARAHAPGVIAPERIVVIGDTPHDVACARSGGATAIAVATGIHSLDDLHATEADVVFEDLSDTREVLKSFLRSAS
jgi:phosphoglycolate phosphatase-like HAD superfamily hydrolase